MLQNDMDDSELVHVSATGKKSQRTTKSDDIDRKEKKGTYSPSASNILDSVSINPLDTQNSK